MKEEEILRVMNCVQCCVSLRDNDIESVSSRCKYYRQIDFMCSDTWSSDVDFINSLIKELIINAVSFTYSIFYFVYYGLSRAGGSPTECTMTVY